MKTSARLSSYAVRLLVVAAALPFGVLAQQPARLSGNLTIASGQHVNDVKLNVPVGKRFTVEFLNVLCAPQGTTTTTIPIVREITIATHDNNNPFGDGTPITFTPGKTAAGLFNYINVVKFYADHSGYSNYSDIDVIVSTESNLPQGHSMYCTVVMFGTMTPLVN